MSKLTNKDVFNKVKVNDNSVLFATYNFKNPKIVPNKLSDKIKDCEVKQSVCFASILRNLKNSNHNMAYITINTKDGKYKLNNDIIKRWLKITKRYKMLPYYITPKCFSKNKIKTHLVLENLPPSLIFIYLSVLRYPRENPSFVKKVIHLYDNKELNFWSAFVLASYVHVTNTGHHISSYIKLNVYSDYKTKPADVTEEIDISTMIGLQRMINNPKKYDSRITTKLKNNKWIVTNDTIFYCAEKLDNIIESNKYTVPIKDLTLPRVVQMVNSTNKKELDHEFNLYKKEKKVE